MTWQHEVYLSTNVGVLPVIEGSFTVDRGWSPMGQGTMTVPLQAWEALGLHPLQRHPMVLHTRLRNYMSTATLGHLWGPGALGTAAWPTAEAVPFRAGDQTRHATTAWRVYLQDVQIDRLAGEAVLQLATFELVLHELVNNASPWMPTGLTGGGFDAGDVLRQLFDYAHLHAPLVVSAGAWLPQDEVSAWEPGTSAFAWWDRLRVLGELDYYLDMTSGMFWIASASEPTFELPSEGLLTHTEEYGTASDEGAAFADALTVVWRWTVTLPDGEVEERTRRDTAYAANLLDWRDSRRHVQVERIGPPVAGYAQRAVDRMQRFRTTHRVSMPLTPELLAPVPGPWQTATFTFGSEPSVVLTIPTS
ncbi:hypothetical protein LG314_07910 [Agrococcus terreus]|uniref:hypothetical protein n=1 Tax=Agrococcus terreus TaxID=574649 RepID=UPI00384DB54B